MGSAKVLGSNLLQDLLYWKASNYDVDILEIELQKLTQGNKTGNLKSYSQIMYLTKAKHNKKSLYLVTYV